MRVKYTSHAKKRMQRRHITEQMIINTISSPEIEYPSFGTTVALKTYGSRKVGVVYITEGAHKKIITVFWRGEKE